MLPDKIGALIIKDKRLLLVGDDYTPHLWTPGGKKEPDETHEECLRRELLEELEVNLISMEYYKSLEFFHEKAQDTQTIHYYFVEIAGVPSPHMEITKLFWYGRENFEKKNPRSTNVAETRLLPQLIEERRI